MDYKTFYGTKGSAMMFVPRGLQYRRICIGFSTKILLSTLLYLK